MQLTHLIPRDYKLRLKSAYLALQKACARHLFSYSTDDIISALASLGLKSGDSVLMHSSFNFFSGFRGSPQQILDCILGFLGPTGNLLMPSLPYRSSSYDYLAKQPLFDVRTTSSEMGIVSEVFRRRRGVHRSLHPTHPVLAHGKDAMWLTEGHENCRYPCGKNTPFDKLRKLQGKILFFDAPFAAFTFIHYIEDEIKDDLPFRLYRDTPLTAQVINGRGNLLGLEVFVFSETAVKLRDPEILHRNLRKRNLIKKTRIGRSPLLLVSAEDAVRCANGMLANRIFFYRI